MSIPKEILKIFNDPNLPSGTKKIYEGMIVDINNNVLEMHMHTQYNISILSSIEESFPYDADMDSISIQDKKYAKFAGRFLILTSETGVVKGFRCIKSSKKRIFTPYR